MSVYCDTSKLTHSELNRIDDRFLLLCKCNGLSGLKPNVMTEINRSQQFVQTLAEHGLTKLR